MYPYPNRLVILKNRLITCLLNHIAENSLNEYTLIGHKLEVSVVEGGNPCHIMISVHMTNFSGNKPVLIFIFYHSSVHKAITFSLKQLSKSEHLVEIMLIQIDTKEIHKISRSLNIFTPNCSFSEVLDYDLRRCNWLGLIEK